MTETICDVYYYPQKPDYEIFADELWIKEEKSYTYSTKIGEGYKRVDKRDNIFVRLSSIPLNGELYIVETNKTGEPK